MHHKGLFFPMCHLHVQTSCSLTALWSRDPISLPLKKVRAHLCAPYLVAKGIIKDIFPWQAPPPHWDVPEQERFFHIRSSDVLRKL